MTKSRVLALINPEWGLGFGVGKMAQNGPFGLLGPILTPRGPTWAILSSKVATDRSLREFGAETVWV